MKSNPITFARYEAVLKELGFSQKIIPGSHVRYDHPPSGTILLVRLHEANEIVPWDVIATARHHLSFRGVSEPEEFEAMLQAVAA